MAAPVYNVADQKVALYSPTTGTDLVVDAPTNISEGDLLLVIIAGSIGLRTVTPDTGFTLIREESADKTSNFRPHSLAFWKVATASEPATYTFTRSDATSALIRLTSGRITGYRLVTASPIDKQDGANSGSGTGESLVLPTVTPAEVDTLLVTEFGCNAGVTAASIVVPSGMTERFSDVANPAHGIATESLATADATGTRTWSWTTAVRRAGIIFNVYPDTGGGGTAHSASVANAATIGESVQPASEFARIESDAVTVGETVARAISWERSAFDAITIGEAASGALGGAVGDILSVEIGADGWFADITIVGLGTGGTYATRLGLGVNNDPSTGTPLITFHVVSKGFDDNGDPTTIARTVYGTTPLNKAYPDHAQKQETVVGSDVKIRVALSDYIYAKDKSGVGNSGTDVTVDIGAGFYTESATPNAAATGFAVTNSSTAPYQPSVANWSWPGYERITGDFKLRCVAFHRHGQQKRPMRCVKFSATDGTNTVEQIVTAPTIDAAMSADQTPVIEYVATLSPTTLIQGAEITTNFIAYPWVGDNPLDSSAGTAQPTPLVGPIKLLCDKSGTYGITYAKVDPVSGNDGTGVAYDVGSYVYGTASAFATIAAAARAIRDYNNANNSRDDVGGGVVELVAGSYNWLGATVSGGYGTKPKTWITVKPGPGVARADVSISGLSGDSDISDLIKLDGVTITSTTANTFFEIEHLWFHGCDFNSASGTIVNSSTTGGRVCYVTQCKLTAFQDLQPAAVTGVLAFGLVRGSEFAGFANIIRVYTVLGNKQTSKYTSGRRFSDIRDAAQGAPIPVPILAYNDVRGLDVSTTAALSFGDGALSFTGAAIVQNLFETATEALGGIAVIGAGETSDTNTPYDNLICWHNLFVGGRVPFGYNSAGTTVKSRSFWSMVGNYWDVRGLKSDVFATNGDLIGNWPLMYQVGGVGNIHGGVQDISASGFTAYYAGIRSLQPTNQAPSYPAFIDRKSFDGTTEGDGLGDYSLQGTSPLLGLVSDGVLPYDIFGNSRPATDDDVGVVSGASLYEPSTADAVTIGESISIASAFSRAFSGAITIGESATTVGTYSRTVSDALNVGEAVSRGAEYVRTASDSVEIGEAGSGFSGGINYSVSASDAVLMGESASHTLARTSLTTVKDFACQWAYLKPDNMLGSVRDFDDPRKPKKKIIRR